MTAYVALLAGTLFLVTNIKPWHERREAADRRVQRRYSVKIATIFAAVMVMGLGLINGISYVAAHNYDGTSHAVSTHDVAKLFGFKSGTSYPLAFNESIENVNPAGHRFGITMYPGIWQDPKLGPVILIDFTRPEMTAQLSIPVKNITFVENEEITPTATVNLAEVTNYTYGRMVVDANPHCDPVVRSALLVCDREITSTPRMSEGAARGGLVTLVNRPDMVTTATFVVSKATHELIKEQMRKSG
jgi:hypothetical protein